MGSKMLIDATHAEETRVVVVRGNRIEEFDFESAARKQLKGNIYLAKVTRVEPSLQAAFVEYGGNRHGFLAFSEIHPDYYQIPLADRQALLREQEEDEAAEAAENQDDDDDVEGESVEHASHVDQPDDEHSTQTVEADDDQDDDPVPRAQAAEAEELPAISELYVPEVEVESEEDAASDADDELPEPDQANDIETLGGDGEVHQPESIGAEDALEEIPRRARRAPRRSYKIQEVIKRRQIILVQVVKEERGNKGAALTTYLSLAGRYCVLMPNTSKGGGISRKITDAGDRRRLKEVARDVEVPKGMGLIVRTAGAQRTRPEIKRDYDYLMRLWENVRDLTLHSEAPALVYEEGSLIKRSIRDLYNKDVDEVLVEGEAAYREAKDFMKMLMPSHAKNVKLYKDSRPLFSRHQTETQLDALYSPTITLPSGGYIVMNQTEALVAIDINSGRATREHNIEDTAHKTNLEACDEIARQLRLRDLAGLVVIDFIDMEENRNNRNVERRLKEALKNDRARIQVGRISHFGLMEMSRQRLRPGLLEGSSRPCPHCEGRGIVRSISSCGLSVLRAIEEHLMNKRAENLTVKCTHEVAFYVLNEKRDNLLNLEQAYGISVFLVPSDDMKGSQVTVERAGERENIVRKIASPVKVDSTYVEEPEEEIEEAVEDEEVDTEELVEAKPARQPRAEGEEGDSNGRKRRRGRRGGKRGGRDREDGEPNAENAGNADGDETGVSEVPTNSDELETINGGDDDSAERAPPENAEGGEENGKGRGRGRRDRFGRNRGGRNRAERGERGPRPEREGGEQANEAQAEHAEVMMEAPQQRAEPAPPRLPEPTFVMPEPAPVEARKWQPPAPTVAAEPTERKVGWWSKKK